MPKPRTYTWTQLNRVLLSTPSEKVVLRIFEQQKKAGASERWLGRIWSRYARLRARRERKELGDELHRTTNYSGL